MIFGLLTLLIPADNISPILLPGQTEETALQDAFSNEVSHYLELGGLIEKETDEFPFNLAVNYLLTNWTEKSSGSNITGYVVYAMWRHTGNVPKAQYLSSPNGNKGSIRYERDQDKLNVQKDIKAITISSGSARRN